MTKQSTGACAHCGREMSRGGMVRHLEECKQRGAAIAAVGRDAGGIGHAGGTMGMCGYEGPADPPY